ncbi:aspartate and glycine-rich protein [Hydra vulgaris]|uniref:aspartate and glycine-rich protein n=1 Tax=Hydra vulgaris TaxID=6087 RepID=UPI001F5FAB7A|nr:aspartate and glycine-rich protein-like isoform X2 [Hydra vulgaris]
MESIYAKVNEAIYKYGKPVMNTEFVMKSYEAIFVDGNSIFNLKNVDIIDEKEDYEMADDNEYDDSDEYDDDDDDDDHNEYLYNGDEYDNDDGDEYDNDDGDEYDNDEYDDDDQWKQWNNEPMEIDN